MYPRSYTKSIEFHQIKTQTNDAAITKPQSKKENEILPEFLITVNYGNLNIFAGNLSFKPKKYTNGKSEGYAFLFWLKMKLRSVLKASQCIN